MLAAEKPVLKNLFNLSVAVLAREIDRPLPEHVNGFVVGAGVEQRAHGERVAVPRAQVQGCRPVRVSHVHGIARRRRRVAAVLLSEK